MYNHSPHVRTPPLAHRLLTLVTCTGVLCRSQSFMQRRISPLSIKAISYFRLLLLFNVPRSPRSVRLSYHIHPPDPLRLPLCRPAAALAPGRAMFVGRTCIQYFLLGPYDRFLMSHHQRESVSQV